MLDFKFKHVPLVQELELYPCDHIEVSEGPGYIAVGFPENCKVADLISVVNFQIGYELLRRA